MTGQRRGYAIALGVAVLALVLSVGAAMTMMTTNNGWHLNSSSQSSSPDGWRQGLDGDEMMGFGGGMMGDWNDQSASPIAADEATSAAEQWAAANQPGTTVGTVVQMPMGYLFAVTKDGQSVGTIIINDDTGRVTWWDATGLSPETSVS